VQTTSQRVERVEAVETKMSFALPQNVEPDPRGSGLLRAKTLDPDRMGLPENYDHQPCSVRDCSALDDFTPNIVEHGFGYIDLSQLGSLQEALQRVSEAGQVQDSDASAIRGALRGRSFPIGNGKRMLVFYIAPEGFIMRTAGPNGRDMNPGASRNGINNHIAAGAVHVDQDVDGTPVKQILRDNAPRVFHHDSPLHNNARSPVFLLNIWIPLAQETAPLALMDKRSLDRSRHQLRYGLPTDSFLKRSADRAVNDIWMMLHDQGQQWYFTSEFDSRRAYIFETLSTPHGAFILPGEDRADARYRQLEAIMAALHDGEANAVRHAAQPSTDGSDGSDGSDETGEPLTLPLRRSIDAMEAAIAHASEHADALCRGEGVAQWRQRAQGAMDRVVRKSIEMRAVGLMIPDVWPLNRR